MYWSIPFHASGYELSCFSALRARISILWQSIKGFESIDNNFQYGRGYFMRVQPRLGIKVADG